MIIYGIHYNRASLQVGESNESLLGSTRQTMDEKKILLPELFFSAKDYEQGAWQGWGGIGGSLLRDSQGGHPFSVPMCPDTVEGALRESLWRVPSGNSLTNLSSAQSSSLQHKSWDTWWQQLKFSQISADRSHLNFKKEPENRANVEKKGLQYSGMLYVGVSHVEKLSCEGLPWLYNLERLHWQ